MPITPRATFLKYSRLTTRKAATTEMWLLTCRRRTTSTAPSRIPRTWCWWSKDASALGRIGTALSATSERRAGSARKSIRGRVGNRNPASKITRCTRATWRIPCRTAKEGFSIRWRWWNAKGAPGSIISCSSSQSSRPWSTPSEFGWATISGSSISNCPRREKATATSSNKIRKANRVIRRSGMTLRISSTD